MLTKPFNEHLLWKGKIQLANYPSPVLKKDMDLPYVNWLTGTPSKLTDFHDVHEKAYARYSQEYWRGVKERAIQYRLEHSRY